MISPLQLNSVNGANSVNFKGSNIQPYITTSKQTLDRDVFQLTAPKKRQGLFEKVKNAITNPVKSAAAAASETKAAEYNRIYFIVDDYNSFSSGHNEELTSEIENYAQDSSTFNRMLNLASKKYQPDQDSVKTWIDKDTYIEFDKLNGKNIPNSVFSGVNEDQNGVLNINGFMNFAGREIIENLTLYPEGSDLEFEAESVTALSTGNSQNAQMGDLAKKLGGPFIAKGLQKTVNGTYYADSITVFHRDENGRIKSATTYRNAKIDDTLNNPDVPVEKRVFGIMADDVFKSKIDNQGIQDEFYFQDYEKFTGIIDSPELRDDAYKTVYTTVERSAEALEISSNQTAKAYLEYEKSTDDGLLFLSRKTVKL